jgi:hypothetical protein
MFDPEVEPPQSDKERIVELERERDDLRGGPAGPQENCSDCGRAMVWARNVWMCPQCVLWRLRNAEEAWKRLLELTRMLDEHPDGYDGPCECKLCCSYADCAGLDFDRT